MFRRNWRWGLTGIIALAGLTSIVYWPKLDVQAQTTYSYGSLPEWPALDNDYCGNEVLKVGAGLTIDGVNLTAYDPTALTSCLQELIALEERKNGRSVPEDIRDIDVRDWLVDIPFPAGLTTQVADVLTGQFAVFSACIFPDGSLDPSCFKEGWALPDQTGAPGFTPGFYILRSGHRLELTSQPLESGATGIKVTYLSAEDPPKVINETDITIGPDEEQEVTGISTVDKVAPEVEEALQEVGIDIDVEALTLANSYELHGRADAGSVDYDGDACRGGGGLWWVACHLIEGISNSIEALERLIYGLLDVNRSQYQGQNCHDPDLREQACNYQVAWGNLRNLTTLAIVGTALVMVIATALDVGWFSNYTIKKYLARLIAGTILVQLSWALGDLLIQITSQLADFVAVLIGAPFQDSGLEGLPPRASEIGLEHIFRGWGGAAGASGIAGVGAASAGLLYISGFWGWPVILASVLLGLLSLLVGFMFLVFREFLIITLLVFSPIGVALWFLPGSDKVWKLYYKTFISLVMVYPVIVGFIAMGRVFVWVMVTSSNGIAKDSLTVMLAFMVYVGMFAAIPFIFKRFVGIISQLTGGNNPAKGLFDRGRQWRSQQAKYRAGWERSNAGNQPPPGSGNQTGPSGSPPQPP